MENIKISIVTVVFNGEATLERCINSVVNQNYYNIEYIVIDGKSTDGTIEIVTKKRKHVHAFRSECDKGIYDAMNKGIALATGDVVGMLNADDYFADEDCVGKIAATFKKTNADMVYADLDYVDVAGNVLRQWRSGVFQRHMFHWGWMPPHPTFYARRILFERWGGYSLLYGTAADFELMVRFLYVHGGVVGYLNKVIVKMVVGGVSNGDFRSRIAAWKNDYRAMREARLPLPLISALMKPLRKIGQFFPASAKR